MTTLVGLPPTSLNGDPQVAALVTVTVNTCVCCALAVSVIVTGTLYVPAGRAVMAVTDPVDETAN